MHIAGTSYDEVMRSFRWELPQRFNIAEAICEQHARSAPAATALIYEDADGSVRNWSFAEISAAANRCANVLAGHGVGPGTVVGIHLAQCPETLSAHVAIPKRGAIALPLFNLFGPDAIGYRLADSGARVLITTPEALARTEQAVEAIDTLAHVITVGARSPRDTHEFWCLLGAASSTAPTAATGADDPALLVYTSGTTGNP